MRRYIVLSLALALALLVVSTPVAAEKKCKRPGQNCSDFTLKAVRVECGKRVYPASMGQWIDVFGLWVDWQIVGPAGMDNEGVDFSWRYGSSRRNLLTLGDYEFRTSPQKGRVYVIPPQPVEPNRFTTVRYGTCKRSYAQLSVDGSWGRIVRTSKPKHNP